MTHRPGLDPCLFLYGLWAKNVYIFLSEFFKAKSTNFPGGLVVKASASNAWGVSSVSGQGSHMLCDQHIKNRSDIVTNSRKTCELAHIKKKIFKSQKKTNTSPHITIV